MPRELRAHRILIRVGEMFRVCTGRSTILICVMWCQLIRALLSS